MNARGYFGIGIYRSKCPPNVGTLWRSAQHLGAGFIFTIGERFPVEARINPFAACREMKQQTDTMKACRHIPWLDVESVEALRMVVPAAEIVGVEIDGRSVSLPEFAHPQRAVYLLGAEDNGIRGTDRVYCDRLIEIPGGNYNVAVAGSLVMYDRLTKVKR
jgi:tRNA G18 (ribose-2'-O)-methylase SpoU